MRWGSLISTLIMAGASTMAPSLFSKFTGIDQGGLINLVGQVQSISSGQGMEERTLAQMRAIEKGQMPGSDQAAPTEDSGQAPDPNGEVFVEVLSAQPGQEPAAAAAQQVPVVNPAPAPAAALLAQSQAGKPGQDPAAALLAQLRSAKPGQDPTSAMLAQLQSLQNGQMEGVSLPQLAAIKDMANGGASPMGGPLGQLNTAMTAIKSYQNQKPILEQWRMGLLQDSEQVRQFYRSHRQKALAYFLLAGLALLGVAALGAIPWFRGLARFVMGMAFGLSGRFLMLVSMAAVAYFAASRINPWPLLPPETLAVPVGYMLLSGLFLRVLDPNYPLWNMMVKSFLAPLASCLGVTGWVLYQPLVWAKLKPMIAARLA
ncbi:MAG: hypothetical protein NTY77_02265 [Elusimicrobia bacterium]|nr:hypothetical protein [Elusimicrobiota bacterium]